MTWQHGTLTGYENCAGGGKNACGECRDARRRNGETRRRRLAYGQTSPLDHLDPTLTLQALHHLTGIGHNTMAIERLTGLPNQQVGRLLNHEQRYVYRETQDRVLCGLAYVLRHPTWQVPSSYVPSARAWQQLRSLSALGWDITWLCHELGYARTTPPFRKQTMRRDTAEKVQALYDRLSGTKGPSPRAAAHARRLGWHVPLAYDDDGQLIPEAIPNALSEARERREDKAQRAAQVAALTAQGLSTSEIAEQLGVTDRTVTRNRARGIAS